MVDFSKLSHEWWDPDGPMKALHDLTPARGEFILANCQNQPKTAIDFGCGAGILTEWLTDKKIECCGIDISQDLIDTAKRHALLSKLDIKYICSNKIESNNKVDLITCLEVFEHCHNHEELMKMFADRLSAKGTLFISSINKTKKAYLETIIAAEYLLKLLPIGTHNKEDFVEPSKIIRLAIANNLELIKAAGIKYAPYSRTGSITTDLSNNYILAFRKQK